MGTRKCQPYSVVLGTFPIKRTCKFGAVLIRRVPDLARCAARGGRGAARRHQSVGGAALHRRGDAAAAALRRLVDDVVQNQHVCQENEIFFIMYYAHTCATVSAQGILILISGELLQCVLHVRGVSDSMSCISLLRSSAVIAGVV